MQNLSLNLKIGKWKTCMMQEFNKITWEGFLLYKRQIFPVINT